MKRQNITQNTADSQQSQPWAVAAFLPYVYPDTFDLPANQQDNSTALKVTPYTVVSDILNITVQTSKTGLNNTAEMELSSGHLNYATILNPGDHAFVWIGNDIQTYQTISKTVLAGNQANGFNSGLKFVGKVHSVREILNTSMKGIKTLRYLVTFKGFTEFESMIYFNPLLANLNSDVSKLYGQISTEWDALLASVGGNGFPIADLMTFFIDLFFGIGPSNIGTHPAGITRSPNDAFLVPSQVGSLLGITSPSKQDLSYSDVLDTIMGIQKYQSSNTFTPDLTSETLEYNQKNCILPLYGGMIALPDNFNNVTIWSLLDAHKNSVLNEMYVTLRTDQFNNIVPTLVVRQQPFTSSRFTAPMNNTLFSELPRWVIDPTRQVGMYNIGTSNATRCNFLQVYGQLYGPRTDSQYNLQLQINDGNFVLNRADVVRSGSRNFILSSNADVQTNNGQTTTSINSWAQLLGDWYMNLHLKLSGTITVTGIQEPICIGDNLEYDGVLFHIESVVHQYVCPEQGEKSFSTTLGLSNGVLTNGNYYYTKAKLRVNANDNQLPGYSDEEVYVNDQPIVSAVSNGSSNSSSNNGTM